LDSLFCIGRSISVSRPYLRKSTPALLSAVSMSPLVAVSLANLKLSLRLPFSKKGSFSTYPIDRRSMLTSYSFIGIESTRILPYLGS
jgi:hypothetical protein